MGREPGAALHVRIPQSLKAILETEASAQNLSLPDYLRKNLPSLQARGVTLVSGGDDGMIPVYLGPQSPVSPINPGYPYGYQPAYGYPQPQPDAMDQFINEMRKMAVARMFMEMIRQNNYSPDQMLAMAQGQGRAGKEEFTMKDMMQYQMMQSQADQAMARAQQALEISRSKGDAKGEKSAMDYIMALITAQMGQSQTFLQQFTALTQSQQAQQGAWYQTALATNKAGDAESRADRQAVDDKMEKIRTDLWTTQMTNVQEINKMQLANVQSDLERIRNDKSKDFLSQIAELYRLRDTSPVYKAAFDAVTGAKDESMLTKLLPQLKELGLDRLIDGVIGTAKNLLVRPSTVPPPSPPMMPELPQAQAVPGMPGPMEINLPEAERKTLEALRLPPAPTAAPTATPTQTPGQTTIEVTPDANALVSKPEDQIGYTNLNNPAAIQAVKIEVIPEPPPGLPTQPQQKTEQPSEA